MNALLIAAGVWALATLSASSPAAATCRGDCSGDGEVTVNELLIGVNIALGRTAVDRCTSIDANGDGEVSRASPTAIDLGFAPIEVVVSR